MSQLKSALHPAKAQQTARTMRRLSEYAIFKSSLASDSGHLSQGLDQRSNTLTVFICMRHMSWILYEIRVHAVLEDDTPIAIPMACPRVRKKLHIATTMAKWRGSADAWITYIRVGKRNLSPRLGTSIRQNHPATLAWVSMMQRRPEPKQARKDHRITAHQ